MQAWVVINGRGRDMKYQRKTLVGLLALALETAGASEALASNRYFDCTSGNMQTASCWSANTKPGTTDSAIIGHSSYAANVTASLTSGSFTPAYEYVGFSGHNGTVNHSGGTNGNSSSATYLISIGHSVGLTGTYNLSGTGVLDTSWLYVGNSGTGILNQTGGTVVVPTYLALGESAGGNGSYNLQGGTLTVSGSELIGSYGGTGSFTQSGGTHTASYIDMALSNSNTGTYNLRGGTLNANGMSGGPGISTLRIDGGTLNIASGGGIDVDNLYVGTTGYSGSYTLSASHHITATNEIIGQGGIGSLTQTGGTQLVTNLSLGTGVNGNGAYNMQGGSLSAATIDTMNAGTASFNFTGGTLAVGTFIGNLTNNGGILAPGASPGTTMVQGDYTQGATGALSIELGGTGAGLFDVLAVSGTVTLAGTLDAVFWNGFNATAGDSFNIVSATNLLGGFDTLNLATLGAGLAWNVAYLYDQDVAGTDYLRLSVQAVPEAETYAMMLAGLGLVGWAARCRKASHIA